jgi:hypothetical protein
MRAEAVHGQKKLSFVRSGTNPNSSACFYVSYSSLFQAKFQHLHKRTKPAWQDIWNNPVLGGKPVQFLDFTYRLFRNKRIGAVQSMVRLCC